SPWPRAWFGWHECQQSLAVLTALAVEGAIFLAMPIKEQANNFTSIPYEKSVFASQATIARHNKGDISNVLLAVNQ
ncbi:MAG TPA: hypothetical protein PKD55_10150, partial [Bellilinea sp.]|nr:hypothetical protein [Bellilinea sp.]